MKVTRGRDVLDLTPEEYLRLLALESVQTRRVTPGTGDDDADQLTRSPSHGAELSNAAESDSHVENPIRTEVFFRKPSPSMARILLAFIAHSGKLSMSEMLSETGLENGSSLRKPGGALNARMREASSNRIQEFYSVRQNSNGNEESERIYVISPEVLDFIKEHAGRIRALASPSV